MALWGRELVSDRNTSALLVQMKCVAFAQREPVLRGGPGQP